jgi:CheY-like chemotaxis protein
MTLKTTFPRSTTRWNGSPDLTFPSIASPPTIRSRGHILIITQRYSEAPELSWAMRALHLDSSWVHGGVEGIAALRRTQFDLVLVDDELSDMTAVDVVRTLQAEYDSRRFVILRRNLPGLVATPGGIGDTPSVLKKPYRCTDVISIINASLGLQHTTRAHAAPLALHADAADYHGPSIPIRRMTVGSIAERWAHFVLGTIDAEGDPKTVPLWARALGVSRSVLSECCRLVHVLPQNARDFTRLLRAICHSGERWEPETVLDVADARTLRKVLAQAGFSRHVAHTPTIPQFLDQQRWIPQTNPGLSALRTLLFDVTRYADRLRTGASL